MIADCKRALGPGLLAGVCLASGPARASAIMCRYQGRTSYDGHLAIEARSSETHGMTRVDVRLVLDAQPLPLFDTHYAMQEISDTDARGIELLAVNSRYRVDGHVVRQSWDMFTRRPDGLDAWRIEGKRDAQFRRQHPGFASHWDFATFGTPWLDDFGHGGPERRKDLDLPDMTASVRPPLALAFHWLQRLPAGPVVVPVFLPGFKDRKRVDLAIGAAGASAAGEVHRQAPLRYPALSPTVPSTATGRLTSGGQVLQLAFDLHGRQGSARGTVTVVGCHAQ